MPNLVHILLRILAGMAGALLLYVAFFLYEDEEARIQNRLEQIWKRIDALQSRAMSKEVAFLQGVTRTTSAILDRLLGHKLVSLQSIAVSMAFSLASYLMGVLFLTKSNEPFIVIDLILVICSILVFFLGSLPAFAAAERPGTLRSIPKTKAFQIGLIVLVIFLAAFGSVLGGGLWLAPWHGDLIVFVGVLVDILFIVCFRWILGRICQIYSLWTIILLVVAIVVVTALLIGPAIAIYISRFYDVISLSYQVLNKEVLGASVGYYVYGVSTTNLVDAACLLLLIVVMLLLLAHRLVWPLMKRLVYAANRKQLIKNTKLLGALGTMLLLYAFPHSHLLARIKGLL